MDESYFRGLRKHSRRGAVGKIVVWGILKRTGWVYTVIVDNAKSQSLLPVMNEKIMPSNIVYIDRDFCKIGNTKYGNNIIHGKICLEKFLDDLPSFIIIHAASIQMMFF